MEINGIAYFFIKCTVGFLVPLLLLDMKELGSRYFDLILKLSIAALMLSYFCSFPQHFIILFIGSLTLLFMLSTLMLIRFEVKFWKWGVGLSLISSIMLLCLIVNTIFPSENNDYMINAFTGALLGGVVLDTMILGHWYLIKPKLSFIYLIRFSKLLIICILLRGLALFLSFEQILFLDIFFWMRVGWGLIAPLVLSILIYQTARLRANRSCTGLLYIATLVIFMGEILANYLTLSTQLPL